MGSTHDRIDGRLREFIERQHVLFVATAPLAGGHVNLSPNVVRLHGTGRVVSIYDPEYAGWRPRFTETRGARAVLVVDVERISDSCGYGVPLMSFEREREILPAHAERRGAGGLRAYRRRKNRASIDGLPAFDDDPEG